MTGSAPRLPPARLGVAVVTDLVSAIVTGELQPGDVLPPEAALGRLKRHVAYLAHDRGIDVKPHLEPADPAFETGPERINDTLSIRRAERVKEMLVQRGVRADRVSAVGRGSREPAVRAPEGVAEARNRRVEISVR